MAYSVANNLSEVSTKYEKRTYIICMVVTRNKDGGRVCKVVNKAGQWPNSDFQRMVEDLKNTINLLYNIGPVSSYDDILL